MKKRTSVTVTPFTLVSPIIKRKTTRRIAKEKAKVQRLVGYTFFNIIDRRIAIFFIELDLI